MNVHLPTHMDKAAFLAWAEGRDERYELVEGRVVMMTRPRLAHAIIVRNLLLALHGRLDRKQWTVIAEFGLDAGPQTLRFPDIVVDRVGGDPNDRWARGPVLLAEVLSRSSVRADLEEKPKEFFRLSSLEAYLVFAQHEARAWIWSRKDGSFPSQSNEIVGRDEVVAVPALSIELPLTEIYSGVTFGTAAP